MDKSKKDHNGKVVDFNKAKASGIYKRRDEGLVCEIRIYDSGHWEVDISTIMDTTEDYIWLKKCVEQIKKEGFIL